MSPYDIQYRVLPSSNSNIASSPTRQHPFITIHKAERYTYVADDVIHEHLRGVDLVDVVELGPIIGRDCLSGHLVAVNAVRPLGI